jgi:hypothetical protein
MIERITERDEWNSLAIMNKINEIVDYLNYNIDRLNIDAPDCKPPELPPSECYCAEDGSYKCHNCVDTPPDPELKKCKRCNGRTYREGDPGNVCCDCNGIGESETKTLEQVIEDWDRSGEPASETYKDLAEAIRTHIAEVCEGLRKSGLKAADDMRDDDIYNFALNDLKEKI